MVSVIVPCYNCERTLDRCINSIRNQTQTVLEVVLVDDGSKDKTGEICDDTAKLDTRIKVVHQENNGLMNAWKRGVLEASGEFIAFCDADDYIDANMIEIFEDKAIQYQVDIVMGGMRQEYSDGTVIYADNRLEEGYYEKKDIEGVVLPSYFSSGKMQSGIILASRCVKLFRKEFLVKILSCLNENISLGEDDLTIFASVLAANSIYCMKNFFPYHYVKNSDSMIVKYDKNMFQKLLNLREQMLFVARTWSYGYVNQIDAEFVSNVLLCIKKEICRNKEDNYRGVRRRVAEMRENEIFSNIVSKCDISKYELKSKIFAYFIICLLYTSDAADD